jgi:hypothetical protein
MEKREIVPSFCRIFQEVVRAWSAWRAVDAKLPRVSECFNKVRQELADVGLLDEGVYLDDIQLLVSAIPSVTGETGYAMERSTKVSYLLGFKEGAIFLPSDLPETNLPGGTLTDTIRHEFAHAWYWLDPEYVDGAWFSAAFGGKYQTPGRVPFVSWKQSVSDATELKREKLSPKDAAYADFVSRYAFTKPSEDFAETFMMFLRYRRSLVRFKRRKGVWQKIEALERAISDKKKILGL